MTTNPSGTTQTQAGWLPSTPSPQDNPHLTLEFAKAYEKSATRIMGPVSFNALTRLGPVGRNTRILDIAAGSGAFAVPAAHAGAAVTAIDISPGMVALLTERLSPFPAAKAQLMDGASLAFGDQVFDAAVSIVGVSMFTDWQRGIGEMARVLRPGGRAIVASWHSLPGAGPFRIMAEALKAVFPDLAPPPPPPGLLALSEPNCITTSMTVAGFSDITIEVIEAVWEGPSGPAYLEEMKGLHPIMGPYAMLDPPARMRVHAALLEILKQHSTDGTVSLTSSMLMATGTSP